MAMALSNLKLVRATKALYERCTRQAFLHKLEVGLEVNSVGGILPSRVRLIRAVNSNR